ncbi:MAG: hypothetical protein K0S55_981 [Clostridia bacterium]|nr:hypothetical protein [Clostridia bacterium]
MKKALLYKFIITILLVMIFLISCDNNVTENNIDEKQPEEINIDLDGYEFTIVGHLRDGLAEVTPDAAYSVMGDNLLEHYKKIEEKCNCKIVFGEPLASHVSFLQQATLTGDKVADILDAPLYDAVTMYKAEYLKSLTEVIDDPYSGKYGTKSQLEAVTIPKKDGADIFGFRAAYWGIPAPTFRHAVYFNPAVLKNFNQPDPFELIERKNWVWSTFEEICLAVASEGTDSTDTSDDTYGTAYNPTFFHFPLAAILSNGVKLVYLDEETGLYKSGMDNPAIIEALQWGQDLVKKGACRIISGSLKDGITDNVIAQFYQGQSAFLVEYSVHGATDKQSLSYNMDEFSWIPFPVGPNGTYGSWASAVSWIDRYFVLPVNGDSDVLRQLLPLLLEPFEGLSENDWRETFANNTFFNTESEKWFFDMYDNAENDFYFALPTFYNGSAINQIMKGTKTPQEGITAIMEKSQKEVDDELNKYLAD